ncbi:MAG: YhdP family protein [Proteobacteria bacterium]|nr:YhdP family protein [Pseudomonadota bacterium]
MKRLLQRLIKGLAYFGAAMVILLAISVGIFRLMLPRLPEYQDEIKDWASAAIGMNVEFSGMNARWRLSGPELSFFDARLNQQSTGDSILMAEEVSVGVGLMRLISDRELVIDRVSIRNSSIDLRQNVDGIWLLQGLPLDQIVGARDISAQQSGDVEIIAVNVDVSYEHPDSGQVVPFLIRSLVASRSQTELVLEAEIDLPDAFGDRLEISANRLNLDSSAGVWRLFVESEGLDVSGWSRLRPAGFPEAESGIADLSLWVDSSNGEIRNASANVVFSNLDISGTGIVAPFGFRGSFEFSRELDGWLLAANQFRMATVDGDWPQSDLQVRVINDENGKLNGLRTNASYFDLEDLKYVSSWLPEAQLAMLNDFSPTGVVRELTVELGSLQSDSPQFDVSATLESAGIAGTGERPGVREFSGRIRADRDGGRVEIESRDLVVDLGPNLSGPLLLDDAFGTVIWRRSRDGMIVLSDSVRIRNADLESQMSLQVSLPAGGDAPFVDFESTWSVYDVSSLHRYLPVRAISPNLRDWLNGALVSGSVTRGKTRFNGALDKFPFDEGEGAFHIEARLEDATLQYSDKWPAPEFRHLDLVVENARLYSHENSAANLGNNVEDARVEIPDLRTPVLSIDGFATGSLESIRTFAMQSPINGVLGGQLDRVEVGGDASFDLSITYPIQDKENYDFATKIRVSDAMVRVQGFSAPVTQLNGVVNVSRSGATSESLFGHFLGQPVDLDLNRVGDESAPYSVVLDAVGRTTAEALQAELGIPLRGVLMGDADFTASVHFPNGRALQPGPLRVEVKSDLYGFESDLPAPLGKSDDEQLALSLSIEFPAADQIVTKGSLAGDINWTALFIKAGGAWDFDRGVLAVGGDYPEVPDVRGLRIHGQTPKLDLHAWLAEGRRGDKEIGLGDRIRSIDLDVNQFYAIGQRFTDHRITVDRSSQDWLIQIIGDDVNGLVTVPYDFLAGRSMSLEMDRLILTGGDEVEPETAVPLDPRTLPGISIRAAEFGMGERYLGQLEADFEKTDRGLETINLKSTDHSFTIVAAAGWIVDAEEESGQRTYFDAELKSTNVEQTAGRLNYEPGIISDSMTVDVDVGWSGGPRKDYMEWLNGNVVVNLGEGRLADVEPGAGRVFGLMSIVALPRRLALDFRDVFDAGFSFDKITGNFRLVRGEAYTCDLTLTGPAADVGIVGRTGLNARDYDQAAIVSANVGNTLPVVGALLGGPQVAAALLVFSQIFKNPLKDVGQVYYSVEGSWDAPLIEKLDLEQFANTSSLAGCIDAPQ